MSPYPDVRVQQQVHLKVAAIDSLFKFISFLGGFPVRFVSDGPDNIANDTARAGHGAQTLQRHLPEIF
jgi:hypothetical protein